MKNPARSLRVRRTLTLTQLAPERMINRNEAGLHKFQV